MSADEPEAGLDWSDAGLRSRRFDDVYFSAVDGLAESRAVFLRGCGLPERWAGRGRFVVGELGFGTGLNVLALLDLWRNTRPPDARLHIFSVEAFPLAQDEARRALAAWPDIGDLAEALTRDWPAGRPGFHRLDFPALGATLDLAVAEAAEALQAWDGRADAWFLDGFAPARNPQMWRQPLLDLVAARSAPSARLATFTVAGSVRRGLAQAGFEVAKRPGFGRKRERLEAVVPETPPAAAVAHAPRTVIIGAGVAGAALARAFRALGLEPVVLEADRPGAGASGNAAALVAPRLDAGGGGIARLHVQAHDRAVRIYRAETPEAVLAQGAWRLEAGPRDAGRFDRLAVWPGFARGALQRRTPDQTALAFGEPVGAGGLEMADALTLTPAVLLKSWLGRVVRAEAAGLVRDEGVWRILGPLGEVLAQAEIVCLAAGPHAARLAAVGPLRAVRGQVNLADSALDGPAAAWGGYAIPAPGGLLFGATHDRDDWDVTVREADTARNLALLAGARPRLAAKLAGATLGGRASLRAATPDHLPLAGAVPGMAGLFVLAGLGGRGFTLAPLLAEEVAATALGAPRPLPRDLAALVDPARYAKESG